MMSFQVTLMWGTYIQGASVIWVRSRENIQEMWPEIKSGKIALWCTAVDKEEGVIHSAGKEEADIDSSLSGDWQ